MENADGPHGFSRLPENTKRDLTDNQVPTCMIFFTPGGINNNWFPK